MKMNLKRTLAMCVSLLLSTCFNSTCVPARAGRGTTQWAEAQRAAAQRERRDAAAWAETMGADRRVRWALLVGGMVMEPVVHIRRWRRAEI